MLINFLNKQINIDRKKIILAVLILIAILIIAFAGIEYLLQAQQIKIMQKELKTQQTNAKIVSFLNLFIEKVLQAQGEVSFENRLKLENAIRDLNDKELLNLWENFTNATTSEQVQQGVKDLLQALVNKILNK